MFAEHAQIASACCARSTMSRAEASPSSTRMVSKKSSCAISSPISCNRAGQPRGHRVHPLRDFAQPARSMVNGIHRGHHRQENLRGADVTRRLVAPNVLLAGLEREAVAGSAGRILRDAHQSSGHVPFVCIAGREIGRVRSARTKRNAEALRAADGDIRSEFARRPQQSQREDVGGDDDQCAGVMRAVDELLVIVNRAVCRGILHERRRRQLP